jgi:predicted AlkP superfamily pyrophosphatase or phosphodiesterase
VRKVAVVNIVGLTPSLIGTSTPAPAQFARRGKTAAIEPVIPEVTCTAQATYFTVVYPEQHGIVANRWYFRDECEVRFWRQSNKLVEAPKVWEMARAIDSSFTCAKMSSWYNMYSTVDYSVTPRPMYPADGRKIPDVYSEPAGLRGELQQRFGQFPLFHFWGATASILSTEWIASATIHVDEKYDPTLTLVYLPHLDYNLQRLGPGDPKVARDFGEIDSVFDKLCRHFESCDARALVVSEYGIQDVSRHINHPRSGELAAIASPGAWFTYYYRLDDRRAPDFARTVDIHRKPGYDPVELFLDPHLCAPKVTVGLKLAKKVPGFRYLMDVIPPDATLVKGSHGRWPSTRDEGPLCITSEGGLMDEASIPAGAVCKLILDHLTKEL